MLLWHELHALCSLSCCDVEYNVIITFLHTQTKKKKNCTCYVRLVVVMNRFVTYGIRAGSTLRLWIARLSTAVNP
jgi:hypothetical protein